MENPKYMEALAKGRSTWGLKPFIYNFDILPDDSLRIPRGCRSMLMRMVKGLDDVQIKDMRTLHEFQVIESNIAYRQYQFDAMNELVNAGPEGMVVAPAGSGKTVLGLSMIPVLGQPCLWLTHTKALAKQAIDRIGHFLPGLEPEDIGFIGEGKWNKGRIITIGMIPTLVRNIPELALMRDDFGIVILDEAHHCPASTFLKVICSLNPYYLYGLTATPYRRDKLDPVMFQSIGPIRVRIPLEKVKADGGIVMPTVKYRTVNSKAIHGNNVQKIIKENIVPNTRRNHLIVGDVIREALSGNYCIVLTDRKAHADILYDLVSIGWDKTGIATGKYSRKYVEEQAALLNKKEITVLVCTFALLGEGFDVDFLNRAFITMPFRAEGKVEQLIGRIQRTAEGKTDAIVYDYVDADIGVLQDQFHTPGRNDCRYKAYKRLGLEVIPYGG